MFGVALLAAFMCGARVPQARPAEPERTPGAQLVHVANGLLTVNVRETSLKELLEEIARQSGLVLEGEASIAERITIQLHQLHLEEGLRVILDGQSYALEYSLATRDEDRQIIRVPTRLRIFPRGDLSAAQREPVDREAEAGLGDASMDVPRLPAVLEDAAEARVNEEALEALAESGLRHVALPLVPFALTDRDEAVRQVADALGDIGGSTAVQPLEFPQAGDRDESVGAGVGAQDHPGLVTISAVSALSSSEPPESYALVNRMIRDRELVLRAVYDDRLLPDRQHERLSQYYQGVPVYGGDVSRQTAGGVTVSVFGTIYTQIDVDPTPGLSTDEATAILENASGATLMQNSLPRLTILPTLNGGYALTYRATLSNATTYFVDAHTGQVLVEVNEIKTESAVGVGTGVLGDLKKVSAAAFSAGAGAAFRAQDQLRPAEILTLDTRGDIGALNRLLTGVWSEIDIAVDSDNTWTDAGVVDAHVHTGWTYDYFFKRHNWTGVDDQNGRIFGIVNDFTVLPLNAFFIPPPFGPEGGGNFAFGETGRG